MDPTRWHAPDFQVVVAGIGLAVVIVQLHMGQRAVAADHLRRQEQSTLEAFANCQRDHREGTRALREEYRMLPLSRQQARVLRGDDPPTALASIPAGEKDDGPGSERRRLEELRGYLREYLNELERIAVGVQHGIYSLDILETQAKTLVVRARQRYEEYIKLVREVPDPETGNRSPDAYVALDWLKEKLTAADPAPRAPSTRLPRAVRLPKRKK